MQITEVKTIHLLHAFLLFYLFIYLFVCLTAVVCHRNSFPLLYLQKDWVNDHLLSVLST